MKARRAVGMTMALSVAGVTAMAGAASAETTSVTPAPEATATGQGLHIPGIITLGRTEAAADGTSGEADGVVVSLLGQTLVGGSQTTPGSSSDALIDTGATPLGRLEVAPWEASTSAPAPVRSSSAAAAVARADVVDPDTVHVDVLQSESHAVHTSAQSAGMAVSDAAVIRLGGPLGLTIKLLHAESDSTGAARTWLLDINGTRVGETVNGCLVDLAPVAGAGCQVAAGGSAASSVLDAIGADVASMITGADAPLARAVASAATGGTGTAISTTGGDAAPRGAVTQVADARIGGGPGGGSARRLATTGASVLAIAAFGMLLVATGLTLAEVRNAVPVAVGATVRTGR